MRPSLIGMQFPVDSRETQRAFDLHSMLKPMTEAIYRRPGDYDLEHEGDDEDVRALSRLVCARQPRRVLELGAGSGRLAIPLARLGAQKGFDVVGLEPAAEMRAGAEEKCSLSRAMSSAGSRSKRVTCELGCPRHPSM